MGSLSSGENITAWARMSRLVTLGTASTNFLSAVARGVIFSVLA